MRNTFLFIFLLFFIGSCKNESEKTIEKSEYKEPLIKVNKYLVTQDDEKIKSFAERRKWNLNVTASGLYYEIYSNGTGDTIKQGQNVKIAYKIYLLDGTLCYNSDSSGTRTFQAGMGQVERGIDEGVKLMKLGSKAHFVLPPHLAFGVPGDGNKIPPRSIIVYNVEVVEVSDN